MRLSDELLRASDDCIMDVIGKVAIMSSASRFGLLPSDRPFEVSLNFGNGYIDIDSLSCRAISRDGSLIDVDFTTRFDNNFATRLEIPDSPGIEEFLLVVEAVKGQWKSTMDGFEEPVYTFSLIGVDDMVPGNGVPVARIIDDYGWRMDQMDFVPPCLFVSAHPRYLELLDRFAELLSAIDIKAKGAIGSGAHGAVSVLLPIVQQLLVAVDKYRDTLSPVELLGRVQQCVSAFTCACELNPALPFTEEKMFNTYVRAPYSVKESFTRISVGLKLCGMIVDKVNAWAGMAAPQQQAAPAPGRPAAPVIADRNMRVTCNTNETTIPVEYAISSASIYFTTDGTTPTRSSRQASRIRDGFRIKFDNGYRREKGEEPDKTICINLVAYDGDTPSNVASYNISCHKDLKFRNAIPI